MSSVKYQIRGNNQQGGTWTASAVDLDSLEEAVRLRGRLLESNVSGNIYTIVKVTTQKAYEDVPEDQVSRPIRLTTTLQKGDVMEFEVSPEAGSPSITDKGFADFGRLRRYWVTFS